MSFCNLSSCFSSIPILLLLFIVLLLVLGGFFFVYSFFNKKIDDQNHKLNSMVGLVSTMAHELQKVGGYTNPPTQTQTQLPFLAPSSTHPLEPSYCSRNSCDELLMCQRRIDVSDDEDSDEDDEDDEDEEDEDEDSDESSDDEEDDDSDSDSDESSDDDQSRIEFVDSIQENSNEGDKGDNIKRISMNDTFLKLDIDESVPILETIKLNDHDEKVEDFHITLVKAQAEAVAEEEAQLEEVAQPEAQAEEPLGDSSIHVIDIHEPSPLLGGEEELKKLSTQKLKQLAVEKGLCADPSKLNKAKLLKLFGLSE